MSYDLNRVVYSIGTVRASEGAIAEMAASQLPGRHNGPADAYRHILLAAELTRRFGEEYARLILNAHEVTGAIGDQTPAERAMDEANNETGIDVGRNSTSWPDVVARSRREMQEGGRASILPSDHWGGNPVDDQSGRRMDNSDPRLNWPPRWPADGQPYPGSSYWPDGIPQVAPGLGGT